MISKHIGGNPSDGGVRTQGVIKALDVGKDGVLRSGAGIETTQMDEVTFQAAEEILRHGVVPNGQDLVRVALAGHALADTELRKALTIGSCSVLNATVRVKNEPMIRLFPAAGHVNCGQRKLGVDAPGAWKARLQKVPDPGRG